MEAKPTLSLCVAIYNQAELFVDFINSLGEARKDEHIEVIVVDDGSTDDIASKVEDLRSIGWTVKYARQSNCGRASALYHSFQLARGEWAMIMDGDDYFTKNGLDAVLAAIKEFPHHPNHYSSGRPVVGLVFGAEFRTEAESGAQVETCRPPAAEVMSLLALRANRSLDRDLKEVVKLEVIRKYLWRDFLGFRRVPTSLLWARISKDHDIITSREVVVVKRYMSDGLTSNISQHKRENLPPLIETHKERMRSNSYSSFAYRFRSQVSFYRYRNIKDCSFSLSGARLSELAGAFLGNSIAELERFARKFSN